MRLSARLATGCLVFLAPATAIVPVLAFAQGGPAPKAEAFLASQETYAGACAHGNARYASHDFDAAIEAYRQAIQIDARNPVAHYLLGEAQLGAGHIAEAEAAWTRAAALSAAKDPTMHGRLLFVLADLKERQWKWEDAKAGWQAYLDWANKFPDAGVFPGSARARVQAIDTMLQLDKATEVVRQRIAATRDGGVFTDPSKGAPPK